MVGTRGLGTMTTAGQAIGAGPPGSSGGGGPPTPMAPAVPAAGFTLTPALVLDAVLNFNNVATVKLYYKARRDSLDTEFDIEPDTLKLFLESLHQRAVAFNWMTTLTIQKNQIHYNLIDGYGTLTSGFMPSPTMDSMFSMFTLHKSPCKSSTVCPNHSWKQARPEFSWNHTSIP